MSKKKSPVCPVHGKTMIKTFKGDEHGRVWACPRVSCDKEKYVQSVARERKVKAKDAPKPVQHKPFPVERYMIRGEPDCVVERTGPDTFFKIRSNGAVEPMEVPSRWLAEYLNDGAWVRIDKPAEVPA